MRKEMQSLFTGEGSVTLPDPYQTVADDAVAFCDCRNGVWLDMGSRSGDLGLAVLAKVPDATMVLLDADAEALGRAVDAARERGLSGRIVPVVGPADHIPLPDGCVDAIVSRMAFCFWPDRAQGLREASRVLRPGGRAWIGGGLGSGYPLWARRAFIQKRVEVAAGEPGGADGFREARRPELFRRLATEAGLTSFEVISNDGLGPDEPFTGVGSWLKYVKQPQHA